MNLKSKLRENAVYWAPGPIARDGSKTYLVPVDVKCHWEEDQRVMVDKKGVQWTSYAHVFVSIRVKEEGALLRDTTLADLADPAGKDPYANSGAAKIKQVEAVPNKRATQTLFQAFL